MMVMVTAVVPVVDSGGSDNPVGSRCAGLWELDGQLSLFLVFSVRLGGEFRVTQY